MDLTDGGLTAQDGAEPFRMRKESQSALQHIAAYNEGLKESLSNPNAPPPVPPKRKHSKWLIWVYITSCCHVIHMYVRTYVHRVFDSKFNSTFHSVHQFMF